MTIMRTITFMLSIFIVGMVELVVAGIMNLMSADLNVSEAWIGQLVTIYAFTFALTGPILVKLTSRYSPKVVLLSAIVFFVVGNLLIALSPNFVILIIGRIISSAAAALIVVKILAVTVVLSRPEHRGKMLGIVYTGFSGSNVFGVPIGTLIGDWLGWRFTFGMIIAVGVLAGILLAVYLPKQLTTHHEEPVTSTKQPLHHKREIFKLLSITFIVLTANSAAYIYINPLILSGDHTIQFVSLALLVIGIAGMLGTSMGGYLTDRLSPKKWLLISVSCFIAIMLILNQLWSTSIWLLLFLFIWHIIQWSTNPAIQSGLIDQAQGDHSHVMSWNMSALNAGIGFGALLGGIIVSHISLFATLYIASLLGVMALVIVISLKSPKTHRHSA
ncbi:chloramphenicol resistance protein [Staphylococcus felis]|uniref:MFS transporter n=1 Tax=Staphylococcus felis TaxID=46127 RepID=UPI000E260F33|nr:MFS transporter [Staphylococcus felis]REH74361.1 chloramphenicol resistance protein [Staphylococcus felis]REI04599.1 chloramphenicol resistance protein [Staphylococcus felis]REI09012.1 chloramphenicol resistance protein [Staphylococcus felis]REI14737.1 chloramphenicol resistance protein [Staphylococcus felis]REI21197.1 chloramphenicol resistance protein [Staphylococcus felis]